MADFNPYAAPETEISAGPRPPDEAGAWSDGALLVMTKGAELPDRCVKCNAPAGGYKLKRNLSWHPPYWYLVLLVNVILYATVALIVRQTARVAIPLCEEHRRKRRRAIAVGWLLGLLGIAPFFVPMVLAAFLGPTVVWGYEGVFILAGIVLLFSGLIYGAAASKVAVPQKIDKRYVWLKKVSPEFLAGLKPWDPTPAVPDLEGL